MSTIVEAAMRTDLKKQTEAIERTNALLTELLTEVKHANELTHWQIDQRRPKAV